MSGFADRIKKAAYRLLPLMAVVLILSLTGCADGGRGIDHPYTKKECSEYRKKAEKYLTKKYPGHEFTVTVENEKRGGSGLPVYNYLEITATDENGEEFNVYYGCSQDDPFIWIMFGFPRFYGDNYEE